MRLRIGKVFAVVLLIMAVTPVHPQLLTNQRVQSKYFEVRLEDFYTMSSATVGVYPNVTELVLDSMLDDESVPPDMFYRAVFRNLRSVAPNLVSLSLNAGFRYRPEVGNVGLILHEVEHIQRSLRTIVGEAHHAGVAVAEIRMQAVLYFLDRFVRASNYLALIRDHFHVVRTVGPRVECRFMVEHTPVDLWITMEEEMHMRSIGVGRTPFHGKGKIFYGLQRKYEKLFHLEDFFYESTWREKRAVRVLCFSPVNFFGNTPQSFYSIAGRNLRTFSPSADHIQMFGGSYIRAVRDEPQELLNELRLLQYNIFAAVQSVQQQGITVDSVHVLAIYDYSGNTVNNISVPATLRALFKGTVQPAGRTRFFSMFAIGATPVRVEVNFVLPPEYASQVDAKAHRGVIEVLPVHLQFDPLFEKIYKKKTVMQSGCRPAHGQSAVFDPCGIKLIFAQQPVETFAEMRPSQLTQQPLLIHVTLGSTIPLHPNVDYAQLYQKAMRNLKQAAPNLRDLRIDGKVTVQGGDPNEKLRLISVAIGEMIKAATAARINMAREFVQVEVSFIGTFPNPTAYQRYMKQRTVEVRPPFSVEYYDDDVLVRVQTELGVANVRAAKSTRRRRIRTQRRRIRVRP